MQALLGFVLGVFITLVGSYEYLDKGDEWVIVKKAKLEQMVREYNAMQERMRQLNYDQRHNI
jgi:hypothetical protein